MRFTITIADLATAVGGQPVHRETFDANAHVLLQGLSTLDQASAYDLAFLSNPKYAAKLASTTAGCILISSHLCTDEVVSRATGSAVLLKVPDAHRAFAAVMQRLVPPFILEPGHRSATATIHPTAVVDASAAIGPGCVIGSDCVVAEGVQLVANVVLYNDVQIGKDSILHGNVTVGSGCVIGQHCIIHPGVVIGADGFGFFENADGSYQKIPQVGNVVVGNSVEIGANTCIDRAAVGRTIIEDGVKLDNLVHIAHGVTVGQNTAIAAQAGISGSAVIGARNRIAGQVGIVGHIATADNVTVMAQSGVAKAISQPGVYFGSPAKDHRTALRIEGVLRRLPELAADVEELKHSKNDTSKHHE